MALNAHMTIVAGLEEVVGVNAIIIDGPRFDILIHGVAAPFALLPIGAAPMVDNATWSWKAANQIDGRGKSKRDEKKKQRTNSHEQQNKQKNNIRNKEQCGWRKFRNDAIKNCEHYVCGRMRRLLRATIKNWHNYRRRKGKK